MCLRQVTVVTVVPPIAVDMLLSTEAGDRTAFASVHTIICGAAPLSADLERQLRRNTGVVRVQQGKTHDLSAAYLSLYSLFHPSTRYFSSLVIMKVVLL